MAKQTNAVSKATKVAHALREEIATGVLAPGARVDQRGLAARFGLSATPVREALNQLAAEGILVHVPNQGVRVPDVNEYSDVDLDEVYILRSTLEQLATELAHENASRAQLRDLERIHETFVQAYESQGSNVHDVQSYRELNYSFHMRIYEFSGLPRLVKMIQSLWTSFPWEKLAQARADGSAGLDPAVISEHAAIVEALKNGTADEAREAMARHIESGRARLAAMRDMSVSAHDAPVKAS